MENQNEEVNLQNDTEVTENTNEESVVSTETEETEVDIEAEVKKATASLYARMKQAEKEAKEAKAKLAQTSGESVPTGDLTTKDLYALMESKVPQDDVDEVRDYAKLKGITVSEALKTSFIKSLLSEKSEQRNIASASNTGTTRRSSKVSDEVLLENAKRGKFPDNDEDMLRLAGLKG